MLSKDCLNELHQLWLPNVTSDGLNRLIELLEKGSPMLIHGSFTRAVPMGCLATHIAWNHPQTCQFTLDAGLNWLTRVAGLNPGTSLVIREWDRAMHADFEIRADLLAELKHERQVRTENAAGNRAVPIAKASCQADALVGG